MVPGHGAPPGPAQGLSIGPRAWEAASLAALLAAFEPRLGRISEQDVLALAVATVDVDRAIRDLGLPAHPAPPDVLLGARGVASVLASGRTLLLLEPATEGRLAAFLARHGEGLAAAYVRVAGRPRVGLPGSTAPGRTGSTALGRVGRLVAGSRPGDPAIVLVA